MTNTPPNESRLHLKLLKHLKQTISNSDGMMFAAQSHCLLGKPKTAVVFPVSVHLLLVTQKSLITEPVRVTGAEYLTSAGLTWALLCSKGFSYLCVQGKN